MKDCDWWSCKFQGVLHFILLLSQEFHQNLLVISTDIYIYIYIYITSTKTNLSLSSTMKSFVSVLLILITLFSISEAQSHHHNRQLAVHHPIPAQTPPQIRFQLKRIRHCPPFPLPPPSTDDYEIDPRYGVEKRLVPSGPNPLHNWILQPSFNHFHIFFSLSWSFSYISSTPFYY